jgi:hypothetical protein
MKLGDMRRTRVQNRKRAMCAVQVFQLSTLSQLFLLTAVTATGMPKSTRTTGCRHGELQSRQAAFRTALAAE